MNKIVKLFNVKTGTLIDFGITPGKISLGSLSGRGVSAMVSSKQSLSTRGPFQRAGQPAGTVLRAVER